MAGYVPTYDDYSDLRHRFMELIQDYFLVVKFSGLGGPDDVGLGPEILAMKFERAENTVNNLMKIVQTMDFLADSPGVKDLHDSWFNLVDILDGYSGVHERFKPLREMAKAWDMDIGEEVANRVGRPKGSSKYQTPESILELVGPYIKALKGEGKHPTRALVAEGIGVDESTTSNYRYGGETAFGINTTVPTSNTGVRSGYIRQSTGHTFTSMICDEVLVLTAGQDIAAYVRRITSTTGVGLTDAATTRIKIRRVK